MTPNDCKVSSGENSSELSCYNINYNDEIKERGCNTTPLFEPCPNNYVFGKEVSNCVCTEEKTNPLHKIEAIQIPFGISSNKVHHLIFKAIKNFRANLPFGGYTFWRQNRIKILANDETTIEIEYRTIAGFPDKWIFKICNGQIHARFNSMYGRSDMGVNQANYKKIKQHIELLFHPLAEKKF